MQHVEMLRVATAANAFEARVIAARLGCEGVVWELRGNVDGPLTFGTVEVLVTADDYSTAREILLADEVESAFDDAPVDPAPGRWSASTHDLWTVVAVIVAVTAFALARMAAAV